MFGVGSTEFVIIIGIALVLFGPTLIAFWLGYTLGKKRGDETPDGRGTGGRAPGRARHSRVDRTAGTARRRPFGGDRR